MSDSVTSKGLQKIVLPENPAGVSVPKINNNIDQIDALFVAQETEITNLNIKASDALSQATQALVNTQSNADNLADFEARSSPVLLSASAILESANSYNLDSRGGSFTATLPLNPALGDMVYFRDAGRVAQTHPITFAGNGESINGVLEDLNINVSGGGGVLVYVDSDIGWSVTL